MISPSPSPERRWPETCSQEATGCAGAADVRRRLGQDELSPDLCAGQPGKLAGSKWRHPTSSRPRWELSTRGTAREQRLAFIPPVLSPTAPRCLCALDCSCIFSASAVYWVTLVQTRTQRASHPARPFLCHRHCEPLSGPEEHSGGIEPGWASARACPAPGSGWVKGMWSSPGILLCTGWGNGALGMGAQELWACGFAHTLIAPALVEGA